MNFGLKTNEGLLSSVHKYLLGDPNGNERMCYMFGNYSDDGSLVNIIPMQVLLPNNLREKDQKATSTYIQFSADFRAYIYGLFLETEFNAIINCHSHPFDKGSTPFFSYIDDQSDLEEAKYLNALDRRTVTKNLLSASMVFSQNGFSMRTNCFRQKIVRHEVDRVSILGAKFVVSQRNSTNAPKHTSIWSRQKDILPNFAKDTLRNAKIAIVGCGGTGSITAEHLARLGCHKLTLVDNDIVEITNLNRLQGAYLRDIGAKKIDTICNHITNINPEIQVNRIDEQFPSMEVINSLKNSDAIFSCVDNQWSRSILNSLCVRYYIPLFDVGTAVTMDDKQKFKWRFNSFIPSDQRCFECGRFRNYNSEVVARSLATKEMRKAFRERGYVDDADIAAPSVYFLNNLAVAACMAEFFNFVSGSSRPNISVRGQLGDNGIDVNMHSTYDAIMDKPDGNCPSCGMFLGVADSESIDSLLIRDKDIKFNKGYHGEV